jgi:hypothetical protein
VYQIIKYNVYITLVVIAAISLFVNCGIATENKTADSKDIVLEAKGSAVINGNDRSEVRKSAVNASLANAIQQGISMYVDSGVRDENYQQVSKRLKTFSNGFASLIKVISEEEASDIYMVNTSVRVKTIPLVNELVKAGLTKKWRIVVVIPECHINRKVPDPAVESIITQSLIEMKYQLKDQVLAAKVRDSEMVTLASHGDINAVKALFTKTRADILVVGEAFSQGATRFQGMESCRARVEVKAILRDSGTIISSRTAMGSGIDLTEEMAGKMALEKAAAVAARNLIEDISTLANTNDAVIELTIVNVQSITTMADLEHAIRQISGVKSLERLSFKSGAATCTVTIPSEMIDQLQERIEQLKTPNVSILGATKYTLQIAIE